MKKIIVLVSLFLIVSFGYPPLRVQFIDNSFFLSMVKQIIEDNGYEGYQIKVVEVCQVFPPQQTERAICFLFVKCEKINMNTYMGFVIKVLDMNQRFTTVYQVGSLNEFKL